MFLYNFYMQTIFCVENAEIIYYNKFESLKVLDFFTN